jgi:hypothetical protein
MSARLFKARATNVPYLCYNDENSRGLDKDLERGKRPVTQVSLPAVSPISKSAECEMSEAHQKFLSPAG